MNICVNESRAALGAAAGKAIAYALRDRIAVTGHATVAFAAAPSQNETLAQLIEEHGVDWGKVMAYHLDEYAGATADSPHSFRRYLREHIFHRVTPAAFHQLAGEAMDQNAECVRYASLLPPNGFDIALLGIGENGHLAFNDPPCDFADPRAVRIVALDEACRIQQVHDGAFQTLSDVPSHAFTLTVPTLMKASKVFVMAPGSAKAQAVAASLEGPLINLCPASILRTHPDATLFLDRASAAKLTQPVSE
jgi:glucosamine-6-phosphate deaminase